MKPQDEKANTMWAVQRWQKEDKMTSKYIQKKELHFSSVLQCIDLAVFWSWLRKFKDGQTNEMRDAV